MYIPRKLFFSHELYDRKEQEFRACTKSVGRAKPEASDHRYIDELFALPLILLPREPDPWPGNNRLTSRVIESTNDAVDSINGARITMKRITMKLNLCRR